MLMYIYLLLLLRGHGEGMRDSPSRGTPAVWSPLGKVQVVRGASTLR